MSTLRVLLSTFLNFNQIGKKIFVSLRPSFMFQMPITCLFTDAKIKILAFLMLKMNKKGALLCFDQIKRWSHLFFGKIEKPSCLICFS